MDWTSRCDSLGSSYMIRTDDRGDDRTHSYMEVRFFFNHLGPTSTGEGVVTRCVKCQP